MRVRSVGAGCRGLEPLEETAARERCLPRGGQTHLKIMHEDHFTSPFHTRVGCLGFGFSMFWGPPDTCVILTFFCSAEMLVRCFEFLLIVVGTLTRRPALSADFQVHLMCRESQARAGQQASRTHPPGIWQLHPHWLAPPSPPPQPWHPPCRCLLL